jgi:hypothetical protein
MRFVIVNIGCDWPGCSNVYPEGDDAIVERTLTLGTVGRAGTPKTFALCKTHRDELDEILNPLMAKALKAEAVAKPTVGPAATDKTVMCQVPDCGRPFRSRVGLAQHVTRTHGYPSLSDYETEYVPASG